MVEKNVIFFGRWQNLISVINIKAGEVGETNSVSNKHTSYSKPILLVVREADQHNQALEATRIIFGAFKAAHC